MTKTRKRVVMRVTVSIPAGYSAADARREVKANIQHQSMHSMDEGDVRLIGVAPLPKGPPQRRVRPPVARVLAW